jgi:hypothetical protein
MPNNYRNLSADELVHLLEERDTTVANLREHVLHLERQRIRVDDASEVSTNAYNGGAGPSTNFHVGTFTGNVYYNNYYITPNPNQGGSINSTGHSALALRPAAIMPSSSASIGANAFQDQPTANRTATAVATDIDDDVHDQEGDNGSRAPHYSDPCSREAGGLTCSRGNCRYLHRSQMRLHRALLPSLFKNQRDEKNNRRP